MKIPEFANVQGVSFAKCGYTQDGKVFIQQTIMIDDVQTPVMLELTPEFVEDLANRLSFAAAEAKKVTPCQKPLKH